MKPFTPIILSVALLAACATTHHHDDHDATWHTPAGFQQIDAPDDAIFAVRHDADGIDAVVYRFTPAYPHDLLPHAIDTRLAGPFDAESSDQPPGWIGEFGHHNRYGVAHTFSTGQASYVVTITANERPDDELVAELFAGFTASTPPAKATELPTPGLDDGLTDTEAVQLDPPDADGNPRDATTRRLNFDTLLTTGQLLEEPLTASDDVDRYAANLFERLDVVDKTSLPADECSTNCRAYRIRISGDDTHTHHVGISIDGNTARHIQLRSPSGADEQLESTHLRWLDEFLAEPDRFF